MTTPSQKRGDKMRNAATNEAMRSTMRYRHGAIITKGGKILSQGHNHVRTGFSGPLHAHEAIHLPDEALDDEPCCESSSKGTHSSYFSMHAEMHAVTQALRGARPHLPRSGVVLDPVHAVCEKLQHMSLEMQDGSRFSDASVVGQQRCADIKTRCDRALVEGAKREQQRVALATESGWCLKPRGKARAKKVPAACAPRVPLAWRCDGGACVRAVGR